MYPEQCEFSYIPFRGGRVGGVNYGKSRLDFFLISRALIDMVQTCRYEEREGQDFDHKMVSLKLFLTFRVAFGYPHSNSMYFRN